MDGVRRGWHCHHAPYGLWIITPSWLCNYRDFRSSRMDHRLGFHRMPNASFLHDALKINTKWKATVLHVKYFCPYFLFVVFFPLLLLLLLLLLLFLLLLLLFLLYWLYGLLFISSMPCNSVKLVQHSTKSFFNAESTFTFGILKNCYKSQ